MSDQPKPATSGTVCPNCTMTIPTTTGEWTVDGDFINLGNGSLGTSLRAIADAHNAAVDQWTRSRCFVTLESYEQLEKQLAAEREEVERLKRQYDLAVQDCNSTRNREHELRTQLAAERENVKDAQEEAFAAYAEVDAIREQLAAEREKYEAQLSDNDEKWREKVNTLQAQLADNDEQWENKLAAEREKCSKAIEKAHDDGYEECRALWKKEAAKILKQAHELDAERANVQTLVDALTHANYFVRIAGATNTADDFDKLLAKVKEGK